MSVRPAAIWLWLGWIGQGCSAAEPEAPVVENQKACAPDTAASLTQSEDEDDSDQDITPVKEEVLDYSDPKVDVSWLGDVYPFLISKKVGRTYQCVVCHSEYKDPDTLKQPGEIDLMIDTMRATGTRFMPRVGDRVPDNYITMLKRWSKTFKMGKPRPENEPKLAAADDDQQDGRKASAKSVDTPVSTDNKSKTAKCSAARSKKDLS